MSTNGRCFTYVFPCTWEDHCKIGFSRDPLSRIASLHTRWYELFDLERIQLVETESIRDARNLELRLRRPFATHNAAAPSTVLLAAGGHTEWFRGVSAPLEEAVAALAREGYTVHPGRAWLAEMLQARSDRLFEWTLAQLTIDDLDSAIQTADVPHVRDALDAYRALDIELESRLSPTVWNWYRSRR
jgi:Meiotically Up-regulated Gene 113 (MUG113) protein